MKRIYYRFDRLEECDAGMWRITTSFERPRLILLASSLLSSESRFDEACKKVFEEWPMSVEYNMTAYGSNRIAWLGQAACCIYSSVPEECTRMAWGKITQTSRDKANHIANSAIERWENQLGLRSEQLCLNIA